MLFRSLDSWFLSVVLPHVPREFVLLTLGSSQWFFLMFLGGFSFSVWFLSVVLPHALRAKALQEQRLRRKGKRFWGMEAGTLQCVFQSALPRAALLACTLLLAQRDEWRGEDGCLIHLTLTTLKPLRNERRGGRGRDRTGHRHLPFILSRYRNGTTKRSRVSIFNNILAQGRGMARLARQSDGRVEAEIHRKRV